MTILIIRRNLSEKSICWDDCGDAAVIHGVNRFDRRRIRSGTGQALCGFG